MQTPSLKGLSEVQRRVLKKVVGILESGGIPFQVSGGLAAIFYGAARPLYDIDIEVYARDIPRIRELFREYITDDFRRLRDGNFDLYYMTLRIEGVAVDISQVEECYAIGKNGERLSAGGNIDRAKIFLVDGVQIPAVDKEELIQYKKVLARDADIEDINQISRSANEAQ